MSIPTRVGSGARTTLNMSCTRAWMCEASASPRRRSSRPGHPTAPPPLQRPRLRRPCVRRSADPGLPCAPRCRRTRRLRPGRCCHRRGPRGAGLRDRRVARPRLRARGSPRTPARARARRHEAWCGRRGNGARRSRSCRLRRGRWEARPGGEAVPAPGGGQPVGALHVAFSPPACLVRARGWRNADRRSRTGGSRRNRR